VQVVVNVLRKEAWLAIVTALHDVQWNAIEMDAATATAGHGGGKPIGFTPGFNSYLAWQFV